MITDTIDMITTMTIMEDVTEDDVHIINTHISRCIHSTQLTRHIIAHHTIIIHPTDNHITVHMGIKLIIPTILKQGPAESQT